MAELNKTQLKYLARIEPNLSDIQAYVDLHIQGSNTMTAVAIYEGFSSDNECKLDKNDFIASFRLALREDKITGLQNAGRAGYRREGTHSATKDDLLAELVPYLKDLQAFVDLYIQGDTRMTAAVIYEKFKKENGCELKEETFIKAFRLANKEELVTGLESAYRYGYRRKGTGGTASSEKNDDKHGACEIVVDDQRRIVALDRLNWGYQVRKDSGSWTTEAYFSNTAGMLRGIARRLIDDELKSLDGFDITKLLEKVEEVENKITDLLTKATSTPPNEKAA